MSTGESLAEQDDYETPAPGGNLIQEILSETRILRIIDKGLSEIRPDDTVNLEDYARRVERHEVLRDPDQEEELSREYAIGNLAARDILVNMLCDYSFDSYDINVGTSFYVPEFVKFLNQAQSKLAAYHWYTSKRPNLLGNDKINFRPDQSVLSTPRLTEACTAANRVRRMNDPYAYRFDEKSRGLTMSPKLKDIPEEFLPSDVWLEDPGGDYEYTYPSGKYVHEAYMRRASRLNEDIKQYTLNRNERGIDPSKLPRKGLGLIAEQYQLLACNRPFYYVNNSIFMSLANAQVKLLGLRGISHGQLDTYAHRLQPDTFRKIFIKHVQEHQV